MEKIVNGKTNKTENEICICQSTPFLGKWWGIEIGHMTYVCVYIYIQIHRCIVNMTFNIIIDIYK